MSAAQRQEIADAVSTVDGVTCSAYFRQTTKTGDAMVRLDRMTRDSTGFAFINTWQILVLLPSDIATAEAYLDAHTDALIDAVSTVAVVMSVTPADVSLDTGNRLPCVVIEANRESE